MSVYRASGLRVSTQAAGRVEGRPGYAKIAGILLYWAALPRSRQLLRAVHSFTPLGRYAARDHAPTTLTLNRL